MPRERESRSIQPRRGGEPTYPWHMDGKEVVGSGGVVMVGGGKELMVMTRSRSEEEEEKRRNGKQINWVV